VKPFLIFCALIMAIPSLRAAGPLPALTVEISIEQPPDSITAPLHLLKFIVRFTNNSNAPLHIIRPLDGSSDGRIAPFYRVAVKDDSGAIEPAGPFCGVYGLWGDTKWPDDYLILIPPRHTHEIEVTHPVPIKPATTYTIGFEYSMPSDPVEKSGDHVKLSYPAQAWRGTVSAKEITFVHGGKRE